MEVHIGIDGACRNNQSHNNIGAWSFVVFNGKKTTVIKEVKENTTNNQMELTALFKAFDFIITEAIKQSTIYIDSSYVFNGITDWVFKWEQKNFYNKGVLRPNTDIWKGVLIKWRIIQDKGYKVQFKKVKGHQGFSLNEQADLACNEAMDNFLKEKI